MNQILASVRGALKKRPFLTNSIIYGSLYAGAEYSQQFLSKKIRPAFKENSDIDYTTVCRYAVMGTTMYAPSLILWYKWLDSYIPGTAPAVITKKLILDQFVLSPYLIMLFFTGMSIMENSENIFLDVQTKFISTFYKSCMFWLPAQSINFMFIMPKYRVLYMGICGFLWVNILCWAKRQK